MATYKIEITSTAEKQLKKLSRKIQIRISTAIIALGQNPFPPGIRKLSGYEDTFRIRVEDYRVIYQVNDKKVVIIILKLGHRKDIYR